MTYLKKAQDLYRMLGEGNMMDAFEKYYHEDVEMIEATGESFKGKDRNRERMIEWNASVEEMHGGGVYSITSNEDEAITTVESWGEMTFEGQRIKMEEVAVQQWEGDHIIRERFYYDSGAAMGQEQAAE